MRASTTSGRTTPHSACARTTSGLDRTNRPRPYKICEELPHVSPSGALAPPETPALGVIAESSPGPATGEDSSTGEPDLYTLCHYAAGVTKELEMGGREMRFRVASCTGKLYHVDLYAVTGDRGALDAGVYHFDPHTDGLDVLRVGDYRGVLAEAAGSETGIADAPVTIVLISEWWRSAWKYRDRTYRHAFWDSGTILANLLAVAHGPAGAGQSVRASRTNRSQRFSASIRPRKHRWNSSRSGAAIPHPTLVRSNQSNPSIPRRLPSRNASSSTRSSPTRETRAPSRTARLPASGASGPTATGRSAAGVPATPIARRPATSRSISRWWATPRRTSTSWRT